MAQGHRATLSGRRRARIDPARPHIPTRPYPRTPTLLLLLALLPWIAPAGRAGDEPITALGPNVVAFPAATAKYVRLAILASAGGQPCLDELEVFGADPERNLALDRSGAKASASSCLEGYAIHQVAHLNDGLYGNDHSWIAGGTGEEWVQIELPAPALVSRVLFSRDRDGVYSDRMPLSFEVRLSPDGQTWTTVKKVKGEAASAGGGVPATQSISFRQEHARFVRLEVLGTEDGTAAALDEIQLFGKEPGVNVALASSGARAAVSSAAEGSAGVLHDGRGGDACWRAGGLSRQWVQVELPGRIEVNRILFSRDRSGKRRDGIPSVFDVRISLDGRRWKTVASQGQGVVPGPPPAPRPGIAAAAIAPLKETVVPRQDGLGFANLALAAGAKASASSCIEGFAIHQVAHLNDGRYGNDRSWISAGEPSWAEVDLGEACWVYQVALGSDSAGRYSDRAATDFRILTAGEYASDSVAPSWKTVVRQRESAGVSIRRAYSFRPIRARWVRVAVNAANQEACRIDEIEVYGSKEPIPAEKIGTVADYPAPETDAAGGAQLREAFLGEEYAWLKAFGRADVDSGLVDYVRVWQYPEHAADDRLSLPPLQSEPKLDGVLDDACWQGASRGVVRVAYPDDFDRSPLVEHAVWAARRGDDLLLGIRMDRLLSGHVAVLSSGDWKGCGVLAHTGKGLVFRTYRAGQGGIEADKEVPVEGASSRDLTLHEVRLPLALFPGCRERGLRIGLGMGGRHTSPLGRSVEFAFAPLSIAEEGPCTDGEFRVRLSAAPGEAAVRVRGNVPELAGGVSLEPGQSRTLVLPAQRGPIGPELDLEVQAGAGDPYTLHLFRYDPAERALSLMAELADRLQAKGVRVAAEREELARLRARQGARLSAAEADAQAERTAFFEARMAKRRLFLRDPDLAPAARILCVKRHNFEPSHNYSDLLDAQGGPGGSVGILEIPVKEGRLEPGELVDRKLFDSGKGIARDPAADFRAGKVYFGHCAAKGEPFHLMRINPDGTGLKQLTDGPFSDFYPCPLPDGDLAFISTRCRMRFLCWRPQAYVLFRMGADGGGITPLSFANLSEWAPGLMRDGRILWTRSEYQDKGADFSHTLWSIRPDGSHADLVFGNTIIQPNGYANGREVPGTNEVSCTLISHFGDLNGPIVLIDLSKGRFDPEAMTSLTPEVPWPGLWPGQECFRDPEPISRDLFLCAHAPRRRFGIWVIDRYGNREMLYSDPSISVMCPTPFRKRIAPPAVAAGTEAKAAQGELFLADVYRGLEPWAKRGTVKYLRICQEVRADLERLPSGEYRRDHPDFTDWYATPIHLVSGPYGWPSYVAKASWGLVPVEADGSARFRVPADRSLYFCALDKEFNEVQRMRSVVQLQPGEKRSCIGCHESRQAAPVAGSRPAARAVRTPVMAEWEGKPFSFERVVQPVLDRHCVGCHGGKGSTPPNLTGAVGADKVPISYRTLVSQGWVHYFDWSYNPGGNEKAQPTTFGTLRSRLWKVLDAGHQGVKLQRDDVLRLKTWIDLNCPLWPDYQHRPDRPTLSAQARK